MALLGTWMKETAKRKGRDQTAALRQKVIVLTMELRVIRVKKAQYYVVKCI